MRHAKQFLPLRPQPEIEAEASTLRATARFPDGLILLKPPEAACLIGIPAKRLETWRSQGQGPIYFKFGTWLSGGGVVRYDLDDILKWVEQRRAALEKIARDDASRVNPQPIRELRDSGMGWKAIGRRLNIAPGTARRSLESNSAADPGNSAAKDQV